MKKGKEISNIKTRNTIYFGTFSLNSINFTLKFKGIRFHLNPNHPIFAYDQFLILISYLSKNPMYIQQSNLANLKQCFEKLDPYTTVYFESIEEIEDFVNQTIRIFSQPIPTLKYIIQEYIRSNYDDFDISVYDHFKHVDDHGEVSICSNQFHFYGDNEHFKQENYAIIDFCVNSLVYNLIEYHNGYYVGEKSNGIPEGKGTWLSYDLNERYSGYFLDGEFNGYGKYISKILIYDGEWTLGYYSGKGRLFYKKPIKDQIEYEGEFYKGKREGVGVQYYKEGSFYRGVWKDDKKNGFGEFRDKYNWKCGIWKNDKFYSGDFITSSVLNPEKYFIKVINFKEISKKSLSNMNEKKDTDSIQLRKTPKKTKHNGYLFRSRLEARWALFLEFLKIDYLYEPKTFDLKNGHSYTPDFYLPILNIWIEIKPTYPTEEERERAKLLDNETPFQGSKVYIFYGSMSPPFVNKFQEGTKGILFLEDREEEPLCWCQCSICNSIQIGLRGKSPCHPESSNVLPSDFLKRAYDYASSMDFEDDADRIIVNDEKKSLPKFKKGKILVKSKYF